MGLEYLGIIEGILFPHSLLGTSKLKGLHSGHGNQVVALLLWKGDVPTLAEARRVTYGSLLRLGPRFRGLGVLGFWGLGFRV